MYFSPRVGMKREVLRTSQKSAAKGFRPLETRLRFYISV